MDGLGVKLLPVGDGGRAIIVPGLVVFVTDVPIGFFLDLQLSKPFGHRSHEFDEDFLRACRTFIIDVEG